MSQELAWLEPQSPEEIMEDLFRLHAPERLYVLYSGGQDSNCVDHFVAENYPEKYAGRIFSNTTIAAPAVRRFVIEDSRKRGRPLHMVWPKRTFYDLVIRFGFPGPPAHQMIMSHLKYQTWRRFIHERQDAGEKCALVSGVRKKESAMRNRVKQYVRKPINYDDRMTFVKPFMYKNGLQTSEYFVEHGLAKSPAYEYLDISGECLCGSFAEPWELKGIEMGVRFIFDTIAWMERQVAARISELEGMSGRTEEEDKTLRLLRAAPTWGHRAGTVDVAAQSTMEDYCGESCQAG